MKGLKNFIAQNVNTISLVLICIALALSFAIIFWGLEDTDRNVLNLLAVTGTMASFFGLTIALIQIIALKEISVVTKNTITSTKGKLMLGISISDVSDTIRLAKEIDNFLGYQKYEIARYKLLELRDKLIEFKSSSEFIEIIGSSRLDEIVESLNAQNSQLHAIVYSEEQIEYDAENIVISLNEISGCLNDFRHQIKYQTV